AAKSKKQSLDQTNPTNIGMMVYKPDQIYFIMKNCKYCNGEFELRRKDQIYCSEKCRDINDYKNLRKERHTYKLFCLYCRKEYYTDNKNTSSGPRKYCSRSCANSAIGQEIGKRNAVDINCIGCSIVFTVPFKFRTRPNAKTSRTFCSKECANRYHFFEKGYPTNNYRSKLEINFEQHIKSLNKEFISIPKIYGRPDFFFPNIGLMVFVDGCYWHSCNICFPKQMNLKRIEKDERITNTLKNKGYKIIRLWEHDIRKNPMECIEIIRRVLF
ncbi:MAG: hypothetical protein AABY22_32490, partial [Nanoarchaeota archaeon]